MAEVQISFEAEERLKSAVDLFERTVAAVDHRPEALHNTIVAMHSVCGALTHASAVGVAHERIDELSDRARSTAALSPFVQRLQTWPRGYPGDFETIEYIMQAKVRTPKDTPGYWIELHSLTTGIVQQHRNKVAAQADQIASAVRETQPAPARILVLAAGSSPDLARALPILENANVKITLVDSDADAIAYSLARLAPLRGKVEAIAENVLKALPTVRLRGPFDLVVAGGLFDYLPTKVAIALIQSTFDDLLVEGGVFFFTNMAHPNPYRGWMRYVANWRIIERSREDILSMVERACGKEAHCDVDIDGTGLALLIRCTKPSQGARGVSAQRSTQSCEVAG